MHAQDFLIDEGSDRHDIEDIGEEFPEFEVVLSFTFDKGTVTFVIKSINPVNGRAFVIAPEQEEVLRVLDLISEHEGNTLNRLFSSINIIAEEQIILIARVATVFEELNQVGKLAVNVALITEMITADLDGSLKLKQHWLGEEDLPGLETQGADLCLEQLGLFGRFVRQLVYDLVDIDLVAFVHF